MFRFEQADLHRLLELLQFPTKVTLLNGITMSEEELLPRGLYMSITLHIQLTFNISDIWQRLFCSIKSICLFYKSYG